MVLLILFAIVLAQCLVGLGHVCFTSFFFFLSLNPLILFVFIVKIRLLDVKGVTYALLFPVPGSAPFLSAPPPAPAGATGVVNPSSFPENPQLLLNDAQRYEGVTGKAERESFARGQTLGNPWSCFCLF